MSKRLFALLVVFSTVVAFGCGSDDPAEPTPDPDPKCELSASTTLPLAFGSVPVGDMKELSFTVKNSGSGTLTGDVEMAGDPDFSITAGGGAFSLDPDELVTVTVKFMPTSFGDKFATISFGNSTCADVTVAGTGMLFRVELNPTKDNTLYESPTGQWSNGSGDYLFAGRTFTQASFFLRRALLHFDIAGNIPANATIDSVTLRLNMSRTKNPVTTNPVAIHRVTQDWGEGASNAALEEGGGTDPEAGDATWIHTFFDTDMWTTPGGDFGAEVTSIMVGDIGPYTFPSTASLVSEVQFWLDNPASNFGWILVGDESGPTTASAKRFDSRENPNGANPPLLEVYYTP